MDLFILILRLAYTGVFATAAIGKATDIEGSRKSLKGYGIPESMTFILTVWLIAVEAIISFGFVFVDTAWGAAVSALVLLAVFTGFLAYQLFRGNRQNCHCFGQLITQPTGSGAIVRNLVLLTGVAFLVFRGTAGQGAEYSRLSRIDVAILLEVAIFAAVLICFVTLRRMILDSQAGFADDHSYDADAAEVERASGALTDALPIGADAPRFTLPDTGGKAVSLQGLIDEGYPILLFFVGLNCSPCAAMIEDFHRWQQELRDDFYLVFASSGDPEENAAKFGDAGEIVVLQEAREAADAYFARWTPSLVVIGPGGKIVSHVAAGDAAIRSLIERVRRADLSDPRVQLALPGASHSNFIGEKAIEFSHTMPDGSEISNAAFEGKRTLLLFWGANCPHCEGMHDAMFNWIQERKNGDPEIIIFTDDEVLSSKLPGSVIVDPEYAIAGRLGMYGTPSAVLVNEEGVFESETAVGPASIWALLGRNNVN
ncbi:MAG: Thiol-disulfide oxidoreductase ResA [Acidobacteria bacterium OLB17]|nr:MAG: Thiol-disulfide oxidoreductase ResA [Acidobacteria bacterium OLB17]MCZ2391928.1 redoxin domain-containing protein [Acidobacteriota bacterium]